ncbi:MAG: deoxyribodipyrimidine photo-lyase [Flavobacteriaceae bacterium]
MMKKVSIFWFRRDLRVDDNVGLYNALKAEHPVLPIFIFDSEILDRLPKEDARVTFIHNELEKINKKLKSQNTGIDLFFGKPLAVFQKLSNRYDIQQVYANHDYEPYAVKRDSIIKEFFNLKSIQFQTFKDQVIFEKNEIVKADGSPYVVYTPFSKKWLAGFTKKHIESYTSENLLDQLYKREKIETLQLKDIGFTASKIIVKGFHIDSFLIDEYEATRNFPALDQTSRLGPHLRFGTVSVRKMVAKAAKQYNDTFLKELIWREFFMQILWHFPQTAHKCFKQKYERVAWRNNEEEFAKWCHGNTGYPLVDAGMRQLNETGFMHNRVRMLVGSFLCKHLLIDWRWGEAYFAEKLHDYEMASNIGNWQWVAGCGVDAAPYFRIFNPTTQIQKFDKNLAYIKKWVPEFQELTYPAPIVDHKFARERCLKTYKSALA